MAWNEPGGNNKDPWGSNGRDQGPPDLDELMRKLSNKFGGLFGGKNSGDSGGSGGSGGGIPISSFGFWIIATIVAAIWLLSGFYIVEQGKSGVEQRFGAFSAVTEPGLRYHWPYPIESVEIVDVARRRAEEIGYRSGSGTQPAARSVLREALMLTEDENIVDIRMSVQYEIKDPGAYLFNVQNPDETLRQVTESTAREVVGKSTMDFVLTEGRSAVVAEVRELSQNILDQYNTGLEITNVNLQDAQPPDEVQDAFADAIKAREDEQRVINEAEAYRNEVLPRARGEAERELQNAEGYRERVVARAEGEARRFEQLLIEYSKAPEVTRERLFLETIEQVLGDSKIVLMGSESSNNMLFLPIDQMLQRDNRGTSTDRLTSPPLARDVPNPSDGRSTSTSPRNQLRDTSRGRELR